MKFGHVGITVQDLDRSVSFYSEVFGFEEFFRVTRETDWIAETVGYARAKLEFSHMRGASGMHLELIKYHIPEGEPLGWGDCRGSHIPGASHMCLWVEDAEAVAKKVYDWIHGRPPSEDGRPLLKSWKQTVEIPEGPQKGGKGFYMRDPDGFTVEVWQPSPMGAGFGQD